MTTIFARSSNPGKSAIAVYRISGAKALQIAQILTGRSSFVPRHAYFSKIAHPLTKQVIDHGLVTYFAEGKSFTGEQMLELCLHGSVAISKIMFELIAHLPDLRLAEPGEFSRRAFLNGKIDLVQSEAIADLIDAQTQQQHAQAISQMQGDLSNLYNNWRALLLQTLALLESFIDFPDEEIPPQILNQVSANTVQLITNLQTHLNDNKRGEKLRNGITLAIVGAPNVGKSSLMNYLSNRDVAIVCDIPGTTRDAIESLIDIGSYPILLVDTAGIRATQDTIEQAGIQIAKDKWQQADIKLLMLDASNLESAKLLEDFSCKGQIVVVNKIDLQNIELNNEQNGEDTIYISLKNGTNLASLTKAIIAKAKEVSPQEPSITRARYRANLALALQRLESFDINGELSLAAEDLRMAARHLSFITGGIETEEILGEIFANFCIGK